MECISNETFLSLINQYGSIALFILLALGIIALPIPDETLLVLSGFLIKNGHLNPISTAIAGIMGGIFGITISYVFGRTCGHYLIQKYGSFFGLTSEKMEKSHQWFEKYGKWTLFFGYFIPGFRHFNGLIAGMVELEYPIFALFAYAGGLIWASFFLTIGYFFGNYCTHLLEYINFDIEEIVFIACFAALAYFLYRNLRKKKPKS